MKGKNKEYRDKWAGDVAQLVESLLSLCEALGLIPVLHKQYSQRQGDQISALWGSLVSLKPAWDTGDLMSKNNKIQTNRNGVSSLLYKGWGWGRKVGMVDRYRKCFILCGILCLSHDSKIICKSKVEEEGRGEEGRGMGGKEGWDRREAQKERRGVK